MIDYSENTGSSALSFYNNLKKKKKKISHFKMPTLNSDVTVNSYNNFYLFQ